MPKSRKFNSKIEKNYRFSSFLTHKCEICEKLYSHFCRSYGLHSFICDYCKFEIKNPRIWEREVEDA